MNPVTCKDCGWAFVATYEIECIEETGRCVYCDYMHAVMGGLSKMLTEARAEQQLNEPCGGGCEDCGAPEGGIE